MKTTTKYYIDIIDKDLFVYMDEVDHKRQLYPAQTPTVILQDALIPITEEEFDILLDIMPCHNRNLYYKYSSARLDND